MQVLCFEFMSLVALSCLENSISHRSSSSEMILPFFSYIFPKPWSEEKCADKNSHLRLNTQFLILSIWVMDASVHAVLPITKGASVTKLSEVQVCGLRAGVEKT